MEVDNDLNNPEGISEVKTVRVPDNATFDEAKTALYANDIPNLLARLGSVELYDYTPLEVMLRKLTELVHETYGERVKVIPRGSFVSRTALRDSADLDVDLVFPADIMILTSSDPLGMKLRISTMKSALGVDEWGGVTWAPERLNAVLQAIWSKLNGAGGSTWMQLRIDQKNFTRSIPAVTTGIPEGLTKVLEIDLFIKVQLVVNGAEKVVGVDKDGPDGLRRIQTTENSVEGEWIGDRQLGSVDRVALMMLKWWKLANQFPIKSHHLLTALNQLPELNQKDTLHLPRPSHLAFSCEMVIQTMRGILIFLHVAYSSPCNFLLVRKDSKGNDVKDYPFPPVTRGLQDNLFIQFNQDKTAWKKFISEDPDFIEIFERELEKAIGALQ